MQTQDNPESSRPNRKEPPSQETSPLSELNTPSEVARGNSPKSDDLSKANEKQPRRRGGWNLQPRELPENPPERIDFQSRLVLYKQAQTDDMILYMTHIKGKPTFIFVMDKLDPETALDWRGAFRNREGAVLADRDGVVKDSRFLNDTEKENAEDVMVPSLEAAKDLHEANIGLGIVTNQGGYQYGRMSFEDMIAINVRVIQQIANAGGHVDAVFICPFAKPMDEEAEGVHDARKPGPGMFIYAEQLADKNNVPVLASTGDQRTDGAAAQEAGQKFFAITGSTGRWRAELASARKQGKELPELNTNPSLYQEVTEFSDVVAAVLGEQ